MDYKPTLKEIVNEIGSGVLNNIRSGYNHSSTFVRSIGGIAPITKDFFLGLGASTAFHTLFPYILPSVYQGIKEEKTKKENGKKKENPTASLRNGVNLGMFIGGAAFLAQLGIYADQINHKNYWILAIPATTNTIDLIYEHVSQAKKNLTQRHQSELEKKAEQ